MYFNEQGTFGTFIYPPPLGWYESKILVSKGIVLELNTG
jgi:hypothetical protein